MRAIAFCNTRFKEAMRALVARGASEAERGKLIRDTEADYRKGYFAATGRTPELLDDLLAGNLLLPARRGGPSRRRGRRSRTARTRTRSRRCGRR